MNLFTDTSALVKLYHEEPGTENLSEFIHAHADDLVITISDLTEIEFHSAFLKRVRTNEIERSSARSIFRCFEADKNMFNIIETDNIIKEFSIRLLDLVGGEKSLRTLDAIQLSAAIASHRIIPTDYFVSSDKKLLKVAESYFTVFDPENP
jgi:predicted nucleic acid-binding protein